MAQSLGYGPEAGDPVPARPAAWRPEQVAPSSLPDFDWSRYGLDQIWRMVSGQSRRGGDAATAMWADMRALCDSEADKLETALKQLGDHWHDTQEAARLFQEWGARLVLAMRQTAATADTNAPVVHSVNREVEIAKGRLAELMEQKAEYERREAEQGPFLTELRDLGRDFIHGDDPVFSTWRSDLDTRAREVMLHLERNIAHYGDGITWDPHYEPALGPPFELTREPDGGPAWGGGGGLPPSIWGTPQVAIPAPEPGPRWTPPGPGGGPEFEDPTLDGQTVLGGGLGGPGASPLAPGAGGVFVDTPAGRAFAPGGVIGGPGRGGPGAAPGGPGGPTGPGAAGLGAGAGGAGRPGGSGMVPFMPPMMAGQPGARGAGTPAAGRRAGRGSQSVFEAPQGPPAVIRPPEEPTDHDPGPGVIGIDR